MKVEELLALYDNIRVSCHRLEAQQHYVVPYDLERQRAFHEEGRRLPPTPEKQETIDFIREARAAGKEVGRVHIVECPLTPYVRYEMTAAYPENVEAGEEVRIVDRSSRPDLAALTRDFAIFDGGTEHATVVFYDYDDAGNLLRYEDSKDPAVAEQCWRDYRLAWDLAVDLDEYLASHKAG